MWKRWLAIACVGTMGGCAGPNTLDGMAWSHERRAEVAAETGDGIRAAREQQRAEDLRASARVRATRRGGWIWGDVLLQ